MKKVLLGALLIAGSALFAQDVPSNVKKTFQSKFPKAEEAEWIENDESYDVDFYENNAMKSASFNNAGKWLETRTSLEKIPALVEKSVAAKYKGATVDATTLVESADGKVIYEVSAGSDAASYTIVMDKEGKILSSEAIDNDSDGEDYDDEE